jgi:hypothetical protein
VLVRQTSICICAALGPGLCCPMNTATLSTTGTEFTQTLPATRGEIALRDNQLLSWNGDREGCVIEAREGTVWLTQTGDGTDFILSQGESFHVNRRGRVVVQSLGPAARVAVH